MNADRKNLWCWTIAFLCVFGILQPPNSYGASIDRNDGGNKPMSATACALMAKVFFAEPSVGLFALGDKELAWLTDRFFDDFIDSDGELIVDDHNGYREKLDKEFARFVSFLRNEGDLPLRNLNELILTDDHISSMGLISGWNTEKPALVGETPVTDIVQGYIERAFDPTYRRAVLEKYKNDQVATDEEVTEAITDALEKFPMIRNQIMAELYTFRKADLKRLQDTEHYQAWLILNRESMEELRGQLCEIGKGCLWPAAIFAATAYLIWSYLN